MQEQEPALLQGLRALDLTDEQGLYCGRILADLGVDVVKVEKPGGDLVRRLGPFYKDTSDPEKSLRWFALSAGKRSITLDWETERGRELLLELCQSADFVIESCSPGHLDGTGLGYADLSRVNPGLIMTSITPFGQTGPYRGFKGSDLVIMALGGYLYLNGDVDRPPVRISAPQAHYHAGADAAAGTLIALYARNQTGEGQHVDVSMQESVISLLLDAHVLWDAAGWNVTRQGPFRIRPTGAMLRTSWPCADGHVGFFLMGGAGGGGSVRRLLHWMATEGMETEDLESTDWAAFDWSAPDKDLTAHAQEVFGRFFCRHTKAELYEGAVERSVWLFPVSTTADVLQSPQLAARGFWQEVEHPELGVTIEYPGSIARGAVPEVKIRRRAPSIGEHNREVYETELGLKATEVAALRQSGII